MPTFRRIAGDIRPSPAPVIRITIRLLKTIRSVVSTIITGPTEAAPSKTASIGRPRKPVLPIAAHCASTAASPTLVRRSRATAVAIR